MPFTVKTLNDDYEVVFVEKSGNNGQLYLMDAGYNEWMRCERDGGNATLIVNEYAPASWEPAEREGYVLVFSRAEYESMKDKLENTIIDGEDLVYRYEQANLVLQFTQKEEKEQTDEQGFSVLLQNYLDTPCTKVTDAGVLSFLNDYFSVQTVYSISANAGEAYAIYPLLTNVVGSCMIVDEYGMDVNLSYEAGMNQAEEMYLTIYVAYSVH